MKQFILSQFSHFDKSDFFTFSVLKEAILIFFAWAIPAFLFVYIVNHYFPNHQYYHAAIQEGIGPHLWNIIGSLGFLAFGFSVIFSKCKVTSLITKQILLKNRGQVITIT